MSLSGIIHHSQDSFVWQVFSLAEGWNIYMPHCIPGCIHVFTRRSKLSFHLSSTNDQYKRNNLVTHTHTHTHTYKKKPIKFHSQVLQNISLVYNLFIITLTFKYEYSIPTPFTQARINYFSLIFKPAEN